MENKKDEFEKFNPYLGNGRRKKHFIEDILKPILGGLGGIIIIGLYILGMYHSCSKHDEPDMLRYSPFSLYRGIEFFWHNDFAGVNWDERLKENGKASVFFLYTSLKESTNPHELNKNIEVFSKDIKNYPKDKLDLLKTVSKTYIGYEKTFGEDLLNAVKYHINYSENIFSYSGKILELDNKLKQLLPKEYYEQIVKTTKDTYPQINGIYEKLDELDEAGKNERIIGMENYLTNAQSNLRITYKKIFNEDFK